MQWRLIIPLDLDFGKGGVRLLSSIRTCRISRAGEGVSRTWDTDNEWKWIAGFQVDQIGEGTINYALTTLKFMVKLVSLAHVGNQCFSLPNVLPTTHQTPILQLGAQRKECGPFPADAKPSALLVNNQGPIAALVVRLMAVHQVRLAGILIRRGRGDIMRGVY